MKKAPLKYKFFKVRYLPETNPDAYLEVAKIFEFKNPITLSEARKRCESFHKTSNGFCSPISAEFVIAHLKIGIELFRVDKFKDDDLILGHKSVLITL